LLPSQNINYYIFRASYFCVNVKKERKEERKKERKKERKNERMKE
jgi:hypothetical protein